MPTGASLRSTMASPRSTLAFTTRSCSSFTSLKAPGGTDAVGQSTVVSICGLILLPSSMSTAATTTLVEAMLPRWATQLARVDRRRQADDQRQDQQSDGLHVFHVQFSLRLDAGQR